MTSSPGPIPIASRTRTSASVPFATPTARGTPRYAAASSSKAWTFGPRMNCDESSTSSNRLRSSSTSGEYCAATSTSGIFGTARHPSPSPVTDHTGHDRHENRASNDVLGVPELVVELLPVRAERPADRRERERPRNRARGRQQRVPPEWHAEDTSGYRDERADDRGHATDRNGPVAPAVEPPLGL